MTDKNEENPCRQKRGTLIITIEPCNKNKDGVSEQQSKPVVGLSSNEFVVPGFTPKNPRKMEIEIKIKGNDQELFSEEKIHKKKDSFLLQKKHVNELRHIDKNKVSKSDEIISELELISHNLEFDDEFVERRIEMIEKRKYSSDSSESILLEKKPCPRTCPGKFICSAKKHFMGDKCKLHDPTDIGKQILQMHKNGTIKKIFANIDKNLYPDHLLCTISEIRKLQSEAKGKRKTQEGSYGSEIGSSGSQFSGSSTKLKKVPKSSQEKNVNKSAKTVAETKDTPNVVKKEMKSGCFCSK